MTEEQNEMYMAILGNIDNSCYDVTMVDCAFEFERVVKELNELKEKVESGKPVCPHCKKVMSKVEYKGYYDSGDYWECECVWDEDAEDVEHRRGAYA